MNHYVEDLAKIILSSSCNVALTGAGISTPSGIKDFRGPSGIWNTIDPEKFEINYFYRNPEEVWGLFFKYFMLGSRVAPNAAHASLAELERIGSLCAVITQNIDGLHQQAGSKHVIELHGSLRSAVCTSCKRKYDIGGIPNIPGRAPRCKVCGGLLKPDIVFFGEPLDELVLNEAANYASRSGIMLAIGTSLSVSPANYLPIYAKRNGAKLIIINEGPGEVDQIADLIIRERLENVLPDLVSYIKRVYKT